MRAEIVHRGVGRAIEKDCDESASRLVGPALSDGDVAHASNGHEWKGVRRCVHALRCTILPMDTTRLVGRLPRFRLLALDIDGTVTDRHHAVTDAAREAVDRLQAAGIRIILATGRRYRDALPVAAALGLSGPLVTASGALVKDAADHVTLHRAEFAPGVLPAVLAAVAAAGHEPVLYTDSFHEGFDFHCRRLTTSLESGLQTGFDEYLVRNRHLAHVQPDLVTAPPHDTFAGFAMGSCEDMRQLEATLAAAHPGQLSIHTIRSPRYRDWLCEIAPVGIDKWSGVVAVARAWGIDPDEIAAAGDDVNDLPMVQGAALGVAMGNAVTELQNAADRVVADHESGGLLELCDLMLASN